MKCSRCEGYLVREFVLKEYLDRTNEVFLKMFKCVQCGNMIDDVVTLNRKFPPEPEKRTPRKWR